MSRRGAAHRDRLALLLVVVLLGCGAYAAHRLFVHSSTLLAPAIVTRTMDAHRALSPSLDARIHRLVDERFGHRVPPSGGPPKLIALTFDDGPYPVTTPLLLDTLRDLRVRATFFLIGRDAEEEPELTRRIARDGDEIANHTLTHPDLDRLGPAGVRRELAGAVMTLRRLVPSEHGVAAMMRPPHGRYTEETVRVAQRAGYDVILWSDDPGDWRAVTPAQLAQHVETHATAPEILLLHSGRLATIEMLPRIVARFRAAGYRFVTVGELLRATDAATIDHPEHERL